MNTKQSKKPYAVIVADNYHYMDESEQYRLGEYDTYAEALAACIRIVEESLQNLHHAGMSADQLYDAYVGFGDDPFIIGPNSGPRFSAWTYAKERCEAIFARKLP